MLARASSRLAVYESPRKSPVEIKMTTNSGQDTVTYAIGDVHGMGIMLATLLQHIEGRTEARQENARLVFLGDLFDRGPQSDTVLECVKYAFATWPQSVLISGNHEDMLRAALSPEGSDADFLRWIGNGGIETLSAFTTSPTDWRDHDPKVEQSKIRGFMRSRPGLGELLDSGRRKVVEGDYCYVHAGIRPGIPLADQKDYDLAWIRNEFLVCREPFEKIIVHGHTETEGRRPEIWPNRIALDTAACKPGGRLSALELRNGIPQGFLTVPHADDEAIETFTLEDCDATAHLKLRESLVSDFLADQRVLRAAG